MTEATTTTIPAAIVVLLRGALYGELRRACEDAPASHERAGWADVLACIDGARAALTAIGWEASAEQRDVLVTLDAAMIEALEDDADFWDWLPAGGDRICGGTRAGARQGRDDRAVPRRTAPTGSDAEGR